MRILMIGMSACRGGVEAYVENLCGALDGRYEIIHRLPETDIDGVKWICPKNRHNIFRYVRFWRRFFKINRFDAVYFNTCDTVSIDMLRFAKASGVPVRIIHAHSTGDQTRLSLFHRICRRVNRAQLCRYATALLACSAEAGEWMFGERNFRIIRNGIDIAKYGFSTEARVRCRERIKAGDKAVVGFVGRLEPEKNPRFALKIAEYFASADEKTHMILIGNGSLRPQIEDEIRSTGIGDAVTLLGARDDVNEWYCAMDCLVMPSLFEGFPFVLVEAQASGLPCVVSDRVSDKADLTGLVEYVGLDCGPEIWAKRILQASKKPRGDTVRKLTDMGYSAEESAKEVIRIIGNTSE